MPIVPVAPINQMILFIINGYFVIPAEQPPPDLSTVAVPIKEEIERTSSADVQWTHYIIRNFNAYRLLR